MKGKPATQTEIVRLLSLADEVLELASALEVLVEQLAQEAHRLLPAGTPRRRLELAPEADRPDAAG